MMNNWFNKRLWKVLFVMSSVVVIFVIAGADLNLPDNSSENPDIHKPTSDFAFIQKYICISDLFGEEQWTKEKGRTFNEEGVQLTNGKKHPVNICHYALFCYDEYKATGLDKHKKAFLAQVNCLLDTSFYHAVDDDKIAYPYYIKFHDLKPPWYSALAQSEAISVLIRYYALTGDESVLPVIVKIRNFMVSAAEFNCGTMSKTPEGHEWYEEYPNSTQEKQVLNGFLLSVIALFEYSQLFPNDRETKILYENSIQTVKASFQFYDTGSWLRYNRGDKRTVSNGYMKWQILELKFLYHITGDNYFKHLMMLVSTYTFNKPYDAPGSKLRDYDFSVPLTEGKGGVLSFEGKRNNIDLKNESEMLSANVECKINKTDIVRLSDDQPHTFVNVCATDSVKSDEYTMELKLKRQFLISSLKITYAGFDSLTKPEVKLFYKDSSKSTIDFRLISVTGNIKDVKSIEYLFEPVSGHEILIEIKRKSPEKIIRISELKISQPPEKKKFEFCHYTTPVYEAKSNEVIFNFIPKNIKNFVIFSKSAQTAALLEKEKWNPLSIKTSVPVSYNQPANKFYRFMIVGEPRSQDVEIRNVTFKNVY